MRGRFHAALAGEEADMSAGTRARPAVFAVVALLTALAGCGAPGAPARIRASGVAVAGPRFFADTVNFDGAGPFEVRASASGRLVARDAGAGLLAALTAVTERGFVVAVPVGGPGSPACKTRLYRLGLDGAGKPGKPVPLGPVLHGNVWSLAAAAVGDVIGYAISGCAKGGPGYIRVLHVRTGRTRQWTEVNLGGSSRGTVALSGGLSMSADGRLLAFTGWNVTPGGRNISQVVRVLRTDAPPGTAAARSRVELRRPIGQPALLAATLSPDGSTFYLCSTRETRSAVITTIAAYHTADGRRYAVVATLRGNALARACAVAPDPSGRFLLVPYSIRANGHAKPAVVLVARVDAGTRQTETLRLTVPGAGMDPYTGISIAW